LKTKGDLGAQGLQESKGCGYTLDCREKEGRNGDTVGNLDLEITASVTICQVRN